MKIFSFLAGAAAGALAQRWMAARAIQPVRPAAPAYGAGRLRPAPLPAPDDLADEPTHAPPQGDEQLRERIRSHLAGTIPAADAIEVTVSDGYVTLRGELPARDSALLMTQVQDIPGVERVDNKLSLLGSPDEVAPAMTRDAPGVRAGERARSHMS